jgi:EmrB/QacA subfamily drug resistance transporter
VSAAPDLAETDAAPMTHRATVVALSGLMFSMFVVVLSANVVNTSLPRIIADLGGAESSFTWIVTAAIVSMTISLPIWGKFADLYGHKPLVQISLLGYAVTSALAGLSRSPGQLIACRVLQGLAVGGVVALTTVIMADLISPRERGRYMGLLGACTAAGTVSGPLIGGVVTDSVGWRWNFYVGLPLAAVAVVLLQRTLDLPHRTRERVSIDLFGAILLSLGVGTLMVWLTLGGSEFGWVSTPSALLLAGSVGSVAAFVAVERRVPEPILPPALFGNRTLVLAVVASVPIGVATFATTLFLSQYLQLARGRTPTESGLLTMPLILGTLVASTVAGHLITRHGRWKRYVVTGGALLPVGLALIGTVRRDTDLVLVCCYMTLVGVGIGLVLQNVVTVVQNSLAPAHLGTGTSSVAFFRTLGGALGVTALGALLGHRLHVLIAAGLAASHQPVAHPGTSAAVPELATLAPAVRGVVETAYGHAIGDVYLAAVPLALVGLVALALLPNHALGDKSGLELAREAVAEGVAD